MEELDQETQYNENDTQLMRHSESALDLLMSSNKSEVYLKNDSVDLILEAESEPFDTNQTPDENILDTSKYFKNYEDCDVDKNGFIANEEEVEEEITSGSQYAFDAFDEQVREFEKQLDLCECDKENLKQPESTTSTKESSSGNFKKKFGKFLMHLFLPKKPVYVRPKSKETVQESSTDKPLNIPSVTVHQHTKLKFNPTVSTLKLKDSDSTGNMEPTKEEDVSYLVDNSDIIATSITRISRKRKVSRKVKKKIRVANAELFKENPNAQQ